jgi:hypothetical protein
MFPCAENVRGLKRYTEAADSRLMPGVVGERRNFIEAGSGSSGGGVSSEDAGMSSEKTGENPVRRKPKGS